MFHQIEIHEPAEGVFRGVLVQCSERGVRVLHTTDEHLCLEDAEAECQDALAAMFGPVNQVQA